MNITRQKRWNNISKKLRNWQICMLCMCTKQMCVCCVAILPDDADTKLPDSTEISVLKSHWSPFGLHYLRRGKNKIVKSIDVKPYITPFISVSGLFSSSDIFTTVHCVSLWSSYNWRDFCSANEIARDNSQNNYLKLKHDWRNNAGACMVALWHCARHNPASRCRELSRPNSLQIGKLRGKIKEDSGRRSPY